MARIWGSFIGLAVTGAIAGGSAQASQFCADVARAMVAAETDKMPAADLKFGLPGALDKYASCSFSKDLSGARSTNCSWVFPYRSAAAEQAFGQAVDALSACADPSVDIVTDQQVNHPDSFDLRLLRTADGEVSVSIKDKAERRSTYIFLRTTPLD
ncbi:MAG: hypothetical protein AAF415_08880 [Pseudomonadota bacterium]